MKYYLGLDAHSASFTLAGLTEEGKIIRCQSMPTSAHNLIESVTAYKGTRSLVVEECHLADWVKRTLEPYCDAFVICDPKHNRWIWKANYADDKVDAVKLAKLLRGGFIRAIHHGESESSNRRALFLHYYDLTHEKTRIKLKLKSEFRSLAIPAAGARVYQQTHRLEWLEKLKDEPQSRFQAEQYYHLMDQLEDLRQKAKERLLKELESEESYPLLRTFPGIGPVIAAGYMAMIDTPARFSRKNKLWSYAGFGVRRLESDGRVYENRNSTTGNRVLKWIVSENFIGAMRTLKKNKFQKRFETLQTKGLNSKQARRSVCRDILSSVRAAWLKKEKYKDS